MHGDVARLEAMEFANLVGGPRHRVRGGRRVRQVRRERPPPGRVRAVRADQRPAATGGKPKADIVAILDASGKVVARDLNVNAMFGEDLRSKYPAVGTALTRQGDQGHLDAAGAHEPRGGRADRPAGRHDPRRAAGRLRAHRARRPGEARPARHRGRVLPRRQGPHLELHLRGDGRQRQGGRQQDPGAEPGAVHGRREPGASRRCRRARRRRSST